MRVRKIFAIFLSFLIVLFNASYVQAARKTTIKVPAAPTNLSITGVTTNSLTLNFSAVSGASGYKIYRATPNDSNYSLIATIDSNSYTDSGLTASTRYWYYVTSYNSAGSSLASPHISQITNSDVIAPASKTVLGFATYYYAGDSSSYNSMTANTSSINEIATDTFTTDELGNLSGLIPTSQINYANTNGIKPLVMLTNNFSGTIAKTLLESSVNRQNLINNLLNAVKTYGYKGVNVDLEGVYYYDRSYYTTFMSEVYSAFHGQGYLVTISVPAKTSDSPTNSWSGAYDYAQLSSFADEILLMAYDEHYAGGTAGPIASIGWVTNVVNYAVTVIPKEKILLGVAAYGYDWSSSGAKAYSINQINNLAVTYGAIINWDSVSASPYFNYTDSTGVYHTVWFENSTSLAYKLDLVNSSNISGIGIWRLGLENSDYWTCIKNKLNK